MWRILRACASAIGRFLAGGLRAVLAAPPPAAPAPREECLCARLRREAEVLEGRDAETTAAGTALGFVRDLFRPRWLLALEVAFLRQQLGVARRQFKRATLEPKDWAVLVFLSRLFPWRLRGALLLIGPDAFLRRHKTAVKALWRLESRRGRPPLPRAVRELIRKIAAWNRRFGVKRIAGEMRKLGRPVHKRSVRRVLRQEPPRHRPPGQSWATFLRNHLPHLLWLLRRAFAPVLRWCWAILVWLRRPEPNARGAYRPVKAQDASGEWAAFLREHAAVTWACDFFTVPTAFFRQLHVFFLIKLDSREIVHWAVTRNPTDAWTAAQLRHAIEEWPAPKYLVRDGDKKFAAAFAKAAADHGVEVIQTPHRTPRANAFAERWVKTAKTEATNHFCVLDEAHLVWILTEYMDRYYQVARPHQGIAQQIPGEVCAAPRSPLAAVGPVQRRPVLNGLINVFERAELAA